MLDVIDLASKSYPDLPGMVTVIHNGSRMIIAPYVSNSIYANHFMPFKSCRILKTIASHKLMELQII